MRKLAIFLTTIALSCLGFAASPANADIISCTSGSFLVENGVVHSGGFVDGNCSGTAVIPEEATSIGQDAFRATSGLTKVIFDGSSQIQLIERNAFRDAQALNNIALPSSLQVIDEGAFWGTSSLTSLAIPNNVEEIGLYAFRYSGIKTFQISSANNFFSTSSGVLFNKNKTSLIRFPATLTSEYVVPNGVTYIAPLAFENNYGTPNLLKITLPSSVTEIGSMAFAGTSTLTNVVIPDSVTTIGVLAFLLSGLQSITIPSNVTSIADSAFENTTIENFYFLRRVAPYPASEDPLPFAELDAVMPKIFVPIGASNYGANGGTWKGLEINIGFRATFLGNGSTSGTPPQQVMRAAMDTFPVPGNPGGLKRTGYTFLGWNDAADGTGTNFPVNGEGVIAPEDINLYAQWLKNAEATTKPSISGTATSTANGKNKLTAAKGKWTGTPAPTYTYQWYKCSVQVKKSTQAIPKTCSAIAKATTTKLAVIKAFKGKYLAVAVKGTVAGTPATQWLSKSTGKVN